MTTTHLIFEETEHFGLALAVLFIFSLLFYLIRFIICKRIENRIDGNEDYQLMNYGVGMASNVLFIFAILITFITMSTMYVSEIIYILIHTEP